MDSSYLRPSEEKTEGHLSSCLMRQRFKVLQSQTFPLPNTSSSGLHQQVKTVKNFTGIRFSNPQFLCRRLVREPLPPAAMHRQQQQETKKEVHTSQIRTDVSSPLWSHYAPQRCVTCQEVPLARFVAYGNGPKQHEEEHKGDGDCGGENPCGDSEGPGCDSH